MSPEKKRDFEAEWPLLARRLRHFLSRKNVPTSKQDDLIQDTALRLFKMWDTVDRTRPAWALTVTIALNLLRDEYRRSAHADVVADLPELALAYDVERAGLARVELGRVRSALAEMTPAQRAVLLAEVGHVTDGAVVDAAEKMRRMRARRKLTAILERVSAVIFMPVKRLSELVQAAVAARDPLMAGTSCLLCAVLGLGVAVSTPFGATEAEASVIAVGDVPTYGLDLHQIDVSSAANSGFALDIGPAKTTTAAARETTVKRRGGSSGRASGTGSGHELPLPDPYNPPVPLPEPPVNALPHPDPPNISAPQLPPVPGPGGSDDTTPQPEEEVQAVVSTVQKVAVTVGK